MEANPTPTTGESTTVEETSPATSKKKAAAKKSTAAKKTEPAKGATKKKGATAAKAKPAAATAAKAKKGKTATASAPVAATKASTAKKGKAAKDDDDEEGSTSFAPVKVPAYSKGALALLRQALSARRKARREKGVEHTCGTKTKIPTLEPEMLKKSSTKLKNGLYWNVAIGPCKGCGKPLTLTIAAFMYPRRAVKQVANGVVRALDGCRLAALGVECEHKFPAWHDVLEGKA